MICFSMSGQFVLLCIFFLEHHVIVVNPTGLQEERYARQTIKVYNESKRAAREVLINLLPVNIFLSVIILFIHTSGLQTKNFDVIQGVPASCS